MNEQSAKRSRLRRKEAAKVFYQRFDDQCARLSALEKEVAELIDLVRKQSDASSEGDDDTRTEITSPLPKETALMDLEKSEPSLIQLPVHTHVAEEGRSVLHAMEAAVDTDSPTVDECAASTSHLRFEDDLEALLDTCIHSQNLL